MDMLDNMRKAIDYIEDNLCNDLDYEVIAKVALCSQYHFQRMFIFLTGIPLSEYIRRRRITCATLDLQNTNDKIIDIAFKYNYSSPDSFARTFKNIQGITPTQARKENIKLKVYPRISFSLSLKGAKEMNYRIEKKDSFRIVGIKQRLSFKEDLGNRVGEMWSSLTEDTFKKINSYSNIEPYGLVGAYSEMYEDDTTDYYIGTITDNDNINDLEILDIPSQDWAVFEITGSLPDAMREIWGRIFSEWFPTTEYEHAQAPEIEWYSPDDMSKEDYKSEIWIPIIKD